jgi:hypothetical protein
VDGLSEKWDQGVPTEWEGGVEDMDQKIPLIFTRVASASTHCINTVSFINSVIGDRQFDCSGMGTGKKGVPWVVTTASTNTKQREGECTALVVCKLTYHLFRK